MRFPKFQNPISLAEALAQAYQDRPKPSDTSSLGKGLSIFDELITKYGQFMPQGGITRLPKSVPGPMGTTIRRVSQGEQFKNLYSEETLNRKPYFKSKRNRVTRPIQVAYNAEDELGNILGSIYFDLHKRGAFVNSIVVDRAHRKSPLMMALAKRVLEANKGEGRELMTDFVNPRLAQIATKAAKRKGVKLHNIRADSIPAASRRLRRLDER